MPHDDVPPLRTAMEWARDRLREEIINGVRSPGTQLKQTRIAAEYGISVTPVREAMRDLANEGIILIDPQRVARVRPIDPDDVVEVNELRLLLEPLAARRAAERASADDIEHIRELAARTEAAVDDAEWLRANRAFHLAVIACSRSPRLIDALTNLRQISTFYLGAVVRTAPSSRRGSSAGHRELVEAIAAHDGEAAARIMAAHLIPSDQLAGLVPPTAVDEASAADT